eukprot:TRINITY_DN279_c0_g1_i2.p1 TRINITY_DN279_c0_g1~~TRINITY_DN279_c0_g1_i2.p1  ORF type:complete len:446 (-),score=146.33 TRINITY_DN279_c0_g1_i2:458-1795(-)
MSVDNPSFVYGRRGRQRLSGSRLLLDGNTLSIEDLLEIAAYKIGATLPPLVLDLTPEAWRRVTRARKVVDNVLRDKKTVYGINTGFGNFATTVIDDKRHRTTAVQSDHVARRWRRRANVARAHTVADGVAHQYARQRSQWHSSGNTPPHDRRVQRQSGTAHSRARLCRSIWRFGTIGTFGMWPASLIGVGKMWDRETCSWIPAKDVLAKNNLEPIRLGAKEGLAMINGTQFITSIAAEAIGRIETLVRVADIVAAFTLEALQGTYRAFDPKIHAARPHSGQQLVARRVRALLHSADQPSGIAQGHKDCSRVQDSYTLRCIPQVHGVVIDTLKFVRGIIETEMNSATDNPAIFVEDDDDDDEDGQVRGEIISGGNFHGEYPAKALDYLAIAVHELSNISERRIERLLNPTLSALPAFLTPDGGLNSGFMIAHCTAAALVSENKTLW